MKTHPLSALAQDFRDGRPRGITSVCSAHPRVLATTLRHALSHDGPVLIEATCNQVNQEGGYTGMTPLAFRQFVEQIATEVGFPRARLLLGGDHLGPNPWRQLPADEAMRRAEAMIADYAAAGFSKLHLDTSMGCAGEPEALPDDLVAERAARLAQVAEAHATGPLAPVYVIGTEVPIPGGALEELDHLQITRPEAVVQTHAVHREAFLARGLEAAFARVIALVVQPGVEFGNDDLVAFDAAKAHALSACLGGLPGLVFEAHSTDYQSVDSLRGLVQGGFVILKVGPWLTFALREALYGLDAIADALQGEVPQGRLMAAMEGVMLAAPGNWARHYHGDGRELWLQRHFSWSDRIRYYWPAPRAAAAVKDLLARLGNRPIPAPLISQHLGALDHGRAQNAEALLDGAVMRVLEIYAQAARG